MKPQEDGAHPDNDGKSDIPDYTLVSTNVDGDGNVTNVYKKNVKTRWVDKNGNPLKPDEDGARPDNDGNDIPGYKLVRIDHDKDGNIINVYEKILHTNWVDTNRHPLKPEAEGTFPDNDGISDIPGYKLVRTEVDKDGNITNVYQKILHTNWVDEQGHQLKPEAEGTFPDNDGVSDIDGYTLVRTDVDKDGNITNVYKKNVHTEWVDENGKHLKDNENGEHPDNDGVSDILGYKLVKTYTDKDGNIINVYKRIPKKTPKAPEEPAAPATPQPVTTVSSPAAPPAKLPQTDDKTAELTAAGVSLLGMLGLAGIAKKKRKEEE